MGIWRYYSPMQYRTYPETVKKDAARLRKAGMTIARVAKKLRCSTASVTNWTRKPKKKTSRRWK